MVSPFEAIMQAQGERNQNIPTGAGIGLNRAVPGLGKPASAKRVRPFAQTLGDTPPRDGAFRGAAQGVYDQFPTKSIKRKRRKKNDKAESGSGGSNGANPFGQ